MQSPGVLGCEEMLGIQEVNLGAWQSGLGLLIFLCVHLYVCGSGISYECFLKGWVELESHSWERGGEVVVAMHWGLCGKPWSHSQCHRCVWGSAMVVLRV